MQNYKFIENIYGHPGFHMVDFFRMYLHEKVPLIYFEQTLDFCVPRGHEGCEPAAHEW